MIVKAMDIFSTDPNDPSNCATLADIKVDRAKVQTLYPVADLGSTNPVVSG